MAECVKQLITEAEAVFNLHVLSFDHYRPEYLRADVTAHTVTESGGKNLSDSRFCELRDWFERRGCVISRQRFRSPHLHGVEHTYIAPMQTLSLTVGFHATRTASVESIFQYGLEPGNRDRCTTERDDAVGNIYVSQELGSPDQMGTARWWREIFAKRNRFGDQSWSILKVDFSGVDDIKFLRDMWSGTGVVVRTAHSIPPSRLTTIVQ